MLHRSLLQTSRALWGQGACVSAPATPGGGCRIVGFGSTLGQSTPGSLFSWARCHLSPGANKNCHGSNAKSEIMRAFQQKLKQCLVQVNDRLNLLSVLFAEQCNVIAAQRIRRTCQIATLYRNLGYDKHFVKNAVERLGANFRNKRVYLLFGAATFSWEKERISEKEVQEVADEIKHVQHKTNGTSCWLSDDTAHFLNNWEKVIDKENLALFRKPVPNTYLYEYKVYGTFTDIPARAFFNAQMDLDFRRQWDKLVVKLEVVDKDPDSSTEVVQWIMHYPYPMYSREFVYFRRHLIDPKEKLMVIVSRGAEHPTCPHDKRYVRVDTYMSNMVIKPHSTFDENGFDYVLTYFDNPKSQIPSVAYNWMASTGVPDFVDKMHAAAMRLHEIRKGRNRPEDYKQEGRIPM